MKDFLQFVGLNEVQSEILWAVLTLGRPTADEIILNTGFKRGITYKTLNELVDMGLIYKVAGRPARFGAVDPRSGILNLVRENIDRMETELKQLKSRFSEFSVRLEKLYQKQQKGGYARPLSDILVMKEREQLPGILYEYFCTPKVVKNVIKEPVVYVESVDVLQDKMKKFKDSGAESYFIVGSKLLETNKKFLEYVKVLVENDIPVRVHNNIETKFKIADDNLVLVSYRNPLTYDSYYMLIPHKEIVTVFVKAFEKMWEEAEKINF